MHGKRPASRARAGRASKRASRGWTRAGDERRGSTSPEARRRGLVQRRGACRFHPRLRPTMDDRSSPPRPPTRARRRFAKDRPPPPPLRPLGFRALDHPVPSSGSPPASSRGLPNPPKSGTCSVSSHPDTDLPEETLGRVPESRRPRTIRSGAFALIGTRVHQDRGYGPMCENWAQDSSVRRIRDLAIKLQFFLPIGHQIPLTTP